MSREVGGGGREDISNVPSQDSSRIWGLSSTVSIIGFVRFL